MITTRVSSLDPKLCLNNKRLASHQKAYNNLPLLSKDLEICKLLTPKSKCLMANKCLVANLQLLLITFTLLMRTVLNTDFNLAINPVKLTVNMLTTTILREILIESTLICKLSLPTAVEIELLLLLTKDKFTSEIKMITWRW